MATTIFVNLDKSSKVYREEIFGRVLTILTFETEEEAVELASDTLAGLSDWFFFATL
jgi:aldehyde dehydrogenase (NAD+)